MTEYVSHKKVTVEEMTRQEYNDFRGWELPADEDGTDAGYLLNGEDGSMSWVLTKQFEADFTKVEDSTPLTRLRAEAKELGERQGKLKAFIKKGRPDAMSAYNWGLLIKQSKIMDDYLAVLGSRIQAFV